MDEVWEDLEALEEEIFEMRTELRELRTLVETFLHGRGARSSGEGEPAVHPPP